MIKGQRINAQCIQGKLRADNVQAKKHVEVLLHQALYLFPELKGLGIDFVEAGGSDGVEVDYGVRAQIRT